MNNKLADDYKTNKKIITLYNEGTSADAIAKTLSVSSGTILRRLRQLNVSRRPRGGAHHKTRYLEREDPKILSTVLDDPTTTLKEKAAMLQVTPSTLRSYLKFKSISLPKEVKNK